MECVFVLESFYKFDRAVIAQVLNAVITGSGMEMSDLPIHMDALGRYGRTQMHIVDCALAATAADEELPLATFDQNFKRFFPMSQSRLTNRRSSAALNAAKRCPAASQPRIHRFTLQCQHTENALVNPSQGLLLDKALQRFHSQSELAQCIERFPPKPRLLSRLKFSGKVYSGP
jgi:hypothetical protein